MNAAGVPQWTDSVALCTAANDQIFPLIVSDGGGGAIVTWIDGRSAPTYDIYAQRVNAAGVAQWTADGVALGTIKYPQSQDRPAIVPDGAGGAIIAWTGFNGSSYHVYAQQVSAGGVPQWTAGGVTLCTTAYNQVSPTIAQDGAGGAIVAWSDIRNGSGNYDIYAQRVSAAGLQHWPADGVALCTAANDQTLPMIVADGAGGAIVTWEDTRTVYPYTDIYAQRVNAAGLTQWTDDGVALCTAANEQSDPMIASDGAGGAIVTWQDFRGASGYHIYAQRVNAAGAPQWTADGAALCTAANWQFSPRIIPDGAGGAIVTWEDTRTAYPHTDIYAQKVDGAGVVVAVPPLGASTHFQLLAPYPNPTRDGQFTIRFNLPSSERVSAEVFDLEGERVRTLATDREFPPGTQALGWDGRNDAGVGLSSGVYFVEVRVGTHSEARRAILLHSTRPRRRGEIREVACRARGSACSVLQSHSYKGGSAMRRTIALILTLSAIPSAAHAQFWDKLSNPTIPVTLNHPPGLGLKVNKIAFGPASGMCADQIVEALISDLVSSQIEVVDRQNLNAILAEHDFTLSGHVDQASAAAIGKILGPSALVFVKTQRCATEQDRLSDSEKRYDERTKKEYPVRVYYSRTRAFLKVSIQTVDLTTGRIFAARALDYSPEQRNKSYDGYPEAPAEFDVLDIAVRAAVTDVHRMFLSWSEATSLIYYDNKDYGLKEAFELLKSGDVEGAFHRSQENLEKCKGDPQVKGKVLGHAYYNLGMSYMMRNEYDKALENFREAAKLQPGEIVTKAMADCQRAKELALAMQQVEDKAAVEAEKEQVEDEKAAKAEKASMLTNADIIQMAQSKIPDAIIIHKIKNSKSKFDTSSEALVVLTKAGVSEQVVMAMMGP